MSGDELSDLRVATDRRFTEVWEADKVKEERLRMLELWRARIGGFLLALTVMASLPAVVGTVVAVIVWLD